MIHQLTQPKFPELVVFFVGLALLATLDFPISYPPLLIVLLLLGLSATIQSIVQPHKFVTVAGIISLLALMAGLLQFNYIASLAFGLLIIIRLIVVNTRHTVSLVILSVFVGVISLISANFFLPTLNYLAKPQLYLSIGVTFATILVVGYQMLSLMFILKKTRQQLQQQQQRVTTLVDITNKLTRFLPPQIWQPIISNNAKVEVVNQRRKLTILFSDVVGFTDLSDHISPDHLANILNTYLDRMTQITQKYGATLDKFLGDGLLCYFGDTHTGNDRENAISCANMAIEMRHEMAVLRHQWRLLGFEGLYVRMGINTGYCYVGNFGSRNRMTYTVIGKEANFASRLEAAAQNNQILISESTYHLISHVHRCQAVGDFKLKGFQDSVAVWELLDPVHTTDGQNNWVDFNLAGFNLHLNFHEIRNYDKQTIINHLTDALQLVEQKNASTNANPTSKK